MATPFRVLAAITFAAALLGCASQPKPDWTTAPEADIPAYATYGWANNAPERGILDSQVRGAIRSELGKKGYTEATERPDFLIAYESQEYETAKEKPPVSIGFGVGSWGGSGGGGVGASVPVGGGEQEITVQNRLTVRAVDPSKDSEVWIGTTAPFTYPSEGDAVAKAVEGVMAGFPARRN
jgi:hypothetical protein